MTTGFEYTKEFDVDSSWIDGIYYNENDNSVVFDLSDEFYRYSNVSWSEVKTVANAHSPGGTYNTWFKPTFGPAEHLGYWDDVMEEHEPQEFQVPVRLAVTGNHNGNLSPATNEHSLSVVTPLAPKVEVYDHSVSGSPVTTEHSLRTIAVNPEFVKPDWGSEVNISVHYVLDDSENFERTYLANTDSPYDAVEQLHERAKSLGVTGKVLRVVVEFA